MSWSSIDADHPIAPRTSSPAAAVLYRAPSHTSSNPSFTSSSTPQAPTSFTDGGGDSTTELPAGGGVQLPLAFLVVMGTLLIVVILISVVGNSVVCLLVHQRPAMKSAVNLLLAHLACSHLLLAVCCMPFALVTLLANGWVCGDVMCRIVGALNAAFVTQAALVLVVISVDRFLSVVLKLDCLTPQRARRTLAGLWVSSALLALPPAAGWQTYTAAPGWIICIPGGSTQPAHLAYTTLAYCITFFLPITIMAFCYFAIICRMHYSSSLRINCSHPEVSVTAASRFPQHDHTNSHSRTDVRFKTRSFKTIVVLYIVYILCWTPYAICSITWIYLGTLSSNYIAGNVLLWMGYLNCALNPVVYALRIRKFREACQELRPRALGAMPRLHSRALRRVHPSAAYTCRESTTTQI